jgi:putative ABC transport system ATP-binding protein
MTQEIKQPNPVEIADLSKEYRSGRNRITALDNVSLTIQTSEFLAVMGASGSGKSSLLHLIAGLTEPTAGTVKVNNVDIHRLRDAARTRFRLEQIGIVFQSFNLIPTLTAEENILLPSLIEGKKRVTAAQIDEVLELLEMKERRQHRPDSLSGGEQQRAAIGRALVMNPSLILADEPTGNLDSANSEKLCKLLRELCDKQKRTIVVVTHEKSIADWADRCVILKDGRLLSPPLT